MVSFKGIRFPFRISAAGGIATSMATDSGDNTLLRESLAQIIATHVSERVIENDFGCDIDLKLFDPLDTVLFQAVQSSIISAIATWEPRVQVKNVQIIPDNENGKLTIQIRYSVKRTGATDGFEFTV